MTLSDAEVMEELDSWVGFAEALRAEDRDLFRDMIRLSYDYFPAIQANGSRFPSEALFMSLLLAQHKTIIWLSSEIEKMKAEKNEGLDT